MPRKETISKRYIIDTAFLLAKQEGMENVTARKLAAKAGCSTQPIFRQYDNMEDLWKDIFERAVEFFGFYYEKSDRVGDEPFVDLGYGYIKFAMDEPCLFRLLFLGEIKYGKSMYEILNGDSGIVAKEMSKAKSNGVSDPGELFTKMWIFIHGAACMSITGDYDLKDEDTIRLLKSTYNSFR